MLEVLTAESGSEQLVDEIVHGQARRWTIVVELFAPIAMPEHGPAVDFIFGKAGDLLGQKAAVAQTHVTPLIFVASLQRPGSAANNSDHRGSGLGGEHFAVLVKHHGGNR